MPARGIAGARRSVGTVDHQLVDGHALGSRRVLRGAQDEAAYRHTPRGQPLRGERAPQEGGPHVAGTGADRDPRHELVVGVHAAVVAGERSPPAVAVAADPEHGDLLAVDPQLDPLLAGQPVDVADDVPLQADAQLVLAVEREAVAHRDPAPGPERQRIPGALVLDAGPGNLVGLGSRPQPTVADRHPAHLVRGRDVALHERGGDVEEVGVVVEAEAEVVRRQERRRVDLEPQQVADGVGVLRPVEPVNGGAAGVGGGVRGPVEGGLQPRCRGIVGGRLGAGAPAGGRHRPLLELQQHLLPDVGPLANRVERRRVEGQIARAQPLVVAGDAVPVEEGPEILGAANRHRRPGRYGRREDDGGQCADNAANPRLSHEDLTGSLRRRARHRVASCERRLPTRPPGALAPTIAQTGLVDRRFSVRRRDGNVPRRSLAGRR